LIGQLGSGIASGMANLITKNQLLRKVQEKVTGISAEFPLPPLAKETFSDWLKTHTPAANAGELGEVVLFATCYGEYNTPAVAQAAVMVLEHNGFKVRYPGSGVDEDDEQFTCCGLPNIDGGDVASATAKIDHNVARMLPHVRAGRKILVPASSCGMMIKKEWHEYASRPEVKEVADATMDLMEFLVMLGKEKKLKREFPKSLGTTPRVTFALRK
jgi:glycerol-3-phosphate dehydrogenase subunit C